jgi:uncharacterized protein (TIGR02391 family)
MTTNELQGCLGRLKGLRTTLSGQTHSSSDILRNFNRIVEKLKDLTGEDLGDFTVSPSHAYKSAGGDTLVKSFHVLEKVNELIGYLELGMSLTNEVIEVGTLYNAIEDSELRDRCSDILSARGNFDRVINQATQVLEDRLRRKSGSDRNTVGVKLVSEALGGDPSTARLAVSPHADEQEGITHILRGIMVGFRNPTHHQLGSSISREQALKICCFIDFLLGILDTAAVTNRKKV